MVEIVMKYVHTKLLFCIDIQIKTIIFHNNKVSDMLTMISNFLFDKLCCPLELLFPNSGQRPTDGSQEGSKWFPFQNQIKYKIKLHGLQEV